jgi:hypothetical protein
VRKLQNQPKRFGKYDKYSYEDKDFAALKSQAQTQIMGF